MILTIFGILTRICSNSYLNVFQKCLTDKGQKSSVINFYTYLGLTIVGLIFCGNCFCNLSLELLVNIFIMGMLGACGNFFIIKALSIGELSTLAPINSYKPVVALIIGFLYLNETPSVSAILGIFLIIFGTFILKDYCASNKTAIAFRSAALVFSGAEAVFIKKVIILTTFWHAFIFWAISGFIFSFLIMFMLQNRPKIQSYKYQLILILTVGLMQYSTNFVFTKMDVACALALFQLSTLLSVFLGGKIFDEAHIKKKLFASLIMLSGAIIIILL